MDARRLPDGWRPGSLPRDAHAGAHLGVLAFQTSERVWSALAPSLCFQRIPVMDGSVQKGVKEKVGTLHSFNFLKRGFPYSSTKKGGSLLKE